MLATNLFLVFTRRLDSVGIPYMISGSAAAMLYGEPRLTNGLDTIIVLQRDGAARVADPFHPWGLAHTMRVQCVPLSGVESSVWRTRPRS